MENNLVLNGCPIDMVYGETAGNLELKPHFHNSYEIIYVVEGKVECWINNHHYTVTPDSVIFINNMEAHRLEVLDYPYKRYFILIRPDFFKAFIQDPVFSSVFSNRSEAFVHVLKLHHTGREQFIEYIHNLYNEIKNKESFWEDAVKSSLYLLFILLYRNYPEYFPLNGISSSTKDIVRIQKYIEEHFTDSIGLDTVSKVFFMDKYYISHQFKKVTGFTFKEYLIMQRISRAKDLLYYTDEDITQVCMNAGFNNVNHFIRIFKKVEGTTPYQYRKSYRQQSVKEGSHHENIRSTEQNNTSPCEYSKGGL